MSEDLLHRLKRKGREMLFGEKAPRTGYHMTLPDSERPRLLAETRSDFGKLVYGHKGRVVHKWDHYLDFYERYFAPYRGKKFTMLEIGVSQGGSLDVWREYFGPDATIFGIDIDPLCADRVTAPNQVRIGSQADPEFLKSVIAEMGAPDIILDDGSHVAQHQIASFRTLFPLLKEGGIYAIEDMHTAYWPGEHYGGYRRQGTAIELVKDLIDDMHGWYHARSEGTEAKTEVSGIHVHDSMVFIDKARRAAPFHMYIG